MTNAEREDVLRATSKLTQGWQAEVARVEAELATLKRQHEQLRAAAVCYLSALDEPMSNEAAQRVTNTEIRLRTVMAGLDATPAEPYNHLEVLGLSTLKPFIPPTGTVPRSVIAGSRTTVVYGVVVTEYELTPATKQALTVNATLPTAEPSREFDGDEVRKLLEATSHVNRETSAWAVANLQSAVQRVRDSERKP